MVMWPLVRNNLGVNNLVRRVDDLGSDDLVCGGLVVNSFVMCGCNLAVHSWMNHNLVVLDDCLVNHWFVDYWLVDYWLMNDWLVNDWLVNDWFVDDWLVNDWLVN